MRTEILGSRGGAPYRGDGGYSILASLQLKQQIQTGAAQHLVHHPGVLNKIERNAKTDEQLPQGYGERGHENDKQPPSRRPAGNTATGAIFTCRPAAPPTLGISTPASAFSGSSGGRTPSTNTPGQNQKKRGARGREGRSGGRVGWAMGVGRRGLRREIVILDCCKDKKTTVHTTAGYPIDKKKPYTAVEVNQVLCVGASGGKRGRTYRHPERLLTPLYTPQNQLSLSHTRQPTPLPTTRKPYHSNISCLSVSPKKKTKTRPPCCRLASLQEPRQMTLSTSGRVMELSALLVATTTFTTPSPTGPNADITSSFGRSEWNGITCAQRKKGG